MFSLSAANFAFHSLAFFRTKPHVLPRPRFYDPENITWPFAQVREGGVPEGTERAGALDEKAGTELKPSHGGKGGGEAGGELGTEQSSQRFRCSRRMEVEQVLHDDSTSLVSTLKRRVGSGARRDGGRLAETT